MESKPTSLIDVEKVKKQLELFHVGVRDHLGDGAVLVIGTTRGGKSTVMNILAGKEIQFETINGHAKIDVVRKEYAGIITATGFEPIKIFHGSDSGTKLPNYVKVQDDHYWDCPGSFDNRGAETEISNCYYVHTLLHNALKLDKKGVKFVLVQDYLGVRSSGGKSFTDMIDTLCTIFDPDTKRLEDFTRLIDATTFVFNKVYPQDLPRQDSPTDFIANVIREVRSSMPADEISNLPPQKKARFYFLEMMMASVNSLQYVAVPAAQRFQPVSTLTDTILSSTSGLIQKVGTCRPIVGWKPKIAVSHESLNAVFLIEREYDESLTEMCGDLQGHLQGYFESLRLDKTCDFVDGFLSFLDERNGTSYEGAYEAFLHLKKLFDSSVDDEKVKLTLECMGDRIRKKSSLSMLIDTESGVDFTKRIITAVRMAADRYFTEEERKALKKYEEDSRNYDTEQKSLSKVKKVFGAPVWLVTAGLHGTIWSWRIFGNFLLKSDTVLAGPFEATWGWFSQVQGKCYGYFSKPNREMHEERSTKIRKKREDLKDKTGRSTPTGVFEGVNSVEVTESECPPLYTEVTEGECPPLYTEGTEGECPPLSSQKPPIKNSVSHESLNAVLLQREYDVSLTEMCGNLEGHLKGYFASIGLHETCVFVDDLLSFWQERNRSSFDGPYDEFMHLLKLFNDSVDENVTHTLNSIGDLIGTTSSSEMLIPGANLTERIITAVRKVAATYLSDEEDKALEEYGNYLRDYDTERKSLSKVTKVFAAPVWLVTAGLQGVVWSWRKFGNFVTVVAGPFEATREWCCQVQGNFYGYRYEPNHEMLEEKIKMIQEKKQDLETQL